MAKGNHETEKVKSSPLLSDDSDLKERMKEALHLLEAISADRSLLSVLAEEERIRLEKAAGNVFCPDVHQRRKLSKAIIKQRRQDKLSKDQQQLNGSGIRSLRKKPVYTTPNFYPPKISNHSEEHKTSSSGEVINPQNCYICKQDYSKLHAFYDQLCPTCAELNFRKRTETADLSGRVALLTGGGLKLVIKQALNSCELVQH
jgi:hypothetical protein